MEKLLLRITFSACLIFGAYALNSYTSGGFTNDLTGSPLSTSTCQTGCHSTFPLNSGVGSVSMSVPATYYPGSVYAVSLTVNESVPKYGFMAGVLRDNNTNGGTFANGTGSSVTTINGRSYTRHSGFNSTGTWTFNWTAPNYVDTLTFYYVGNAANNSSGNNGDYIYTASTTIHPLDLITFDTTIAAVSCFSACDGSISLSNVNGGAGAPYTFDWSNNATAASVNGLCAGSYTVTITDNDGNEEVSTLSVGSPSPIIANIFAQGSTCTGGSGNASVSPTGGAGTYSFLWSNGSTDSLIQNLALGWYFITITDASGCTAVDSTEVMEQGSGLLADLTTQNERCGQSDGSITANPLNGTSPYSFNWNTGATTAIINNLSVGSYTVTITDNNGCSESFTVNVENEELIIDAAGSTVSNVVCPGIPSASIDVTIEQGIPPFTYAWSNGASTASIAGLLAGSYAVTVTDANGCSDDASFEVTSPDSIDAVADIINAFGGTCNGTVSITAMGGTGNLSYSWSHDASATGSTLNDLCAGDYSITVADENACNVVLNVTVDENVGIDHQKSIQLSIYPNPAQEQLFIRSAERIQSISITDMNGRTMRTWKNDFTALDVSTLPSGRYQVFVQTNAALILRPLLIHR